MLIFWTLALMFGAFAACSHAVDAADSGGRSWAFFRASVPPSLDFRLSDFGQLFDARVADVTAYNIICCMCVLLYEDGKVVSCFE